MIRTDLGIATAYAEAVSKGYTGTRDEFGKMFVDFGKTAEKVTEDKKAVEQMKLSVEETKNFVDTTAAEFGQDVADKTEEAKAAITEHVNTEKASATAAISEAKDDATGAITEVQTSATDAIATVKDSAVAEITKNGTDTLATIPEDYTTLSKDVDSLKKDTAAQQKRQNVLVGSETGNPVSCDDAFAAPLCGLNVYGKSTQDGTPTPDAPVPIVSAGDGGSVVVNVMGANALEGTKIGTKLSINNVVLTTNENGISVVGKDIEGGRFFLHNDTKTMLPRGIYYLTTKGLTDSVTINFYQIGNFTSDVQKKEIKIVDRKNYSCLLTFAKGATVNATVQVSLTRNKTTAYSPYREQLLTMPTPTGLPGIPVTSGGNYTDPQGQQWVCDEMDLERGVKVQRVDKAAFDSTKTLAEQNAILAAPIETPLTPAEIAAYKALTTYAPDTVVQASDGAGIKLDYQRDVNLVVKNLEDAIASMTTT